MQTFDTSGVQYTFNQNQFDPSRNAKLKKIAIALGVVALLMTLGIGIFSLLAGRTSTPGTSPTNRQNGQIQPETNSQDSILNNRDLQNNREYLKQKYIENGQKPPVQYQYKFNYKLDPQLQSDAGFSLVKAAYAANECNLAAAPVTLDMFTLQSRYKEADAQKIADLFVLPAPAALLSSGTVFPIYFFNDAQTSAFLSVYSGSGAYAFRAPIVPAGTVTTDAINRASELAMQDFVYSLQYNDPNEYVFEGLKREGDNYLFTYHRKWGEIPLVDEATVRAQSTASLCGIPSTTLGNKVEVSIAPDARLTKLNYMQRTIKETIPVTRIKLSEALAQYGSDLPVDPIVSPEGKVVAGDVTITDVVLVYYEYGIETPEEAYVPFYLTRGTVKATDGTTVTVHTLFPTMTKYAMSQYGLVLKKDMTNDAIVGRHSTQQQGTFSVKALVPTDAPHSPKLSAGGSCPGKQIDYSPLTCKTPSGSTICTATALSLPTSPDPLKVCDSGTCQAKQGIIPYKAGDNPCLLFLQNAGIDVSSKSSFIHTATTIEGGTASCFVNICPL